MELSEQQVQQELLFAGFIRVLGLFMLGSLIVICHIYGEQFQLNWPEQERVVIRTVLYIVAILTFLALKFIRHILLQLNQRPSEKPAKSRYLMTILLTMLIAESMGIYGFIMYLLGDGVNTLYIFSVLSALAMYLHRPNIEEYRLILTSQQHT